MQHWGKRPDADRYDVVDGQQRLTTFIILMSCLAKRPEIYDRSTEIVQRYVKRGKLGRETYVLHQGADTKAFFEQIVLGDEPFVDHVAIASHDKLIEARMTIEEWLATHYDGNQSGLCNLLQLVEGRIGLLIYEPTVRSEVGVMFEVINNRGRPLTELEKVKNYLIYLASKLEAWSTQELINQKWGDILRNLYQAGHYGDGDEYTFLRGAAVVFFELSKRESGNIYSEIKESRLNLDHIYSSEYEYIDPDKAIKQLEQFIRFLGECSSWYRVLHDPNTRSNGLSHRSRVVVQQLRAQRQHANILPLLFSVLTKVRDEGQEGDPIARLLELIEIVNFRVYLARNSWRSDWGQGPLFSIAAKYWYGKTMAPDERDWSHLELSPDQELERRLVWFTLVRSGATDEHIKEGLDLESDDPYDFSQWSGLRYFLISYEQYRNPKKTIEIDQILARRDSMKSGDYYSLEHIWATKHDPGGDADRKSDWIRRRLGNYCLLELHLNIIGRNQGIDKKIELYRDGNPRKDLLGSDLAQVSELIRIAGEKIAICGVHGLKDTHNGYRAVHEAICDKREKSFMVFAEERWPLAHFDGYHDALAYLSQ